MKFLPQHSKQYPLYMFMYFIIIWAFLFLYSTLKMIPNISENGYVLRKDVCLETVPAGRFDEYEYCVEYDVPIYMPVGSELKSNLKKYGINTGLIVLVLGLLLWKGQKFKETK